MQNKKEFVILAVPVFALLVWAAFDLAGGGASWQCSEVACGSVITAEEWVNSNCYVLPDGSGQVVCTVNINNTNQLVPLSMIDTSTLNQCLDPVCVREVRVRKVNYTIGNLTGGA